MIFAALAGSFAGLFWFALGMTHGYGTQPVYVLQGAPLAAVLVGYGWVLLRERRKLLSKVMLAIAFGLSMGLVSLFTTQLYRPIGWDKLMRWIDPLLLIPIGFGMLLFVVRCSGWLGKRRIQ